MNNSNLIGLDIAKNVFEVCVQNAQGHDVTILPPQHVKPFVRSNKSDARCARDRAGVEGA